MKTITVFFAHKTRAENAELAAAVELLRELLLPRLERQFQEPINLQIVFGRDDFTAYYHGDWGEWTSGVAMRKNATTGRLIYDLFVCPDQRVGRATAGLLLHALQRGRAVFVLNPEARRLHPVKMIACLDDNDWASGYHLIIHPKENEDVPAGNG